MTNTTPGCLSCGPHADVHADYCHDHGGPAGEVLPEERARDVEAFAGEAMRVTAEDLVAQARELWAGFRELRSVARCEAERVQARRNMRFWASRYHEHRMEVAAERRREQAEAVVGDHVTVDSTIYPAAWYRPSRGYVRVVDVDEEGHPFEVEQIAS